MTKAQKAHLSGGDMEAGSLRSISATHLAQIKRLDQVVTALQAEIAEVARQGSKQGKQFQLDEKLIKALKDDVWAVRGSIAQLTDTVDAIQTFEESLEARAEEEQNRTEESHRQSSPPLAPKSSKLPLASIAPALRTGQRPKPEDPSQFVEPIHVPKIEKPKDVMYIIEGDRVIRQSDGVEIPGEISAGARAVRDAYEQGREGMLTIGIAGPAQGRWAIGGSSSKWSPEGVCHLHERIPIKLAIIGMTDDAEVTAVRFTNLQTEVHDLQLWNVGIRGNPDPYIMKGIGEVGLLLLDGCWWLPHLGYISNGAMHRSGWTTSQGFDAVIVRNHKRKTDLLLEEHDFYFKGGGPGGMGSYKLGGMIALLDNELGGGNRTWFQIRPHSDSTAPGGSGTPSQEGPVLIRGNHGKDCLLYTSPSPRDRTRSRMPSSA